MLDPSGRFLRSFGSQGSSDGRFNYPWGITTDALGFIYVCDKENHRIQVNIKLKNYEINIFLTKDEQKMCIDLHLNLCNKFMYVTTAYYVGTYLTNVIGSLKHLHIFLLKDYRKELLQ